VNWSIVFLSAGLWWSAATVWTLVAPPTIRPRHLPLWQALLQDVLAGALLGIVLGQIVR
jgi:hypothetical protein